MMYLLAYAMLLYVSPVLLYLVRDLCRASRLSYDLAWLKAEIRYVCARRSVATKSYGTAKAYGGNLRKNGDKL